MCLSVLSAAPLPPADDDTAAVAERLVAEAGLPAIASIRRMTGGKNNRVFELGLADGSRRVLKRYHVDGRDNRDRLGAEWRFLRHVWQSGVYSVPEPIRADPAVSAGLYGFVDGDKLSAPEIGAAEIAAAAAFVVAINAEPDGLAGFAPGSEACFSLSDHIATVGRRVDRMAEIDVTAPLAAEAARFVVERLRPAWSAVQQRILASAARENLDLAAPVAKAILSPSDFGFHNMLRGADGRLIFIDFEYAGRDDPAKLVCDFFCQPEIPVPAEFFDMFCDTIVAALALPETDRRRCGLLLDAYRIKWVCIILNEFLALGSSRRAFADSGERADRCARQLERAERRLALVSV